LASNSLLEAIVFAENAYSWCLKNKSKIFSEEQKEGNLEEDIANNKERIDEEILINHNWDIIRRIMWNYVGIVRKTSRLLIAQDRIAEVRGEIDQIIEKYQLTTNMLELRNISLVASLIIEASLKRKESKGLHYIIE